MESETSAPETSPRQRIVLIAGGTGLIGTRLQEMLQKAGWSVRLLTRQQGDGQTRFYWDPARDFMNPDALNHCTAIVNLAGAGVADKKWSAARKREIIDSRVQANELLYKKISEVRDRPRTYVSASAVGYYGDRGAEPLDESSAPGKGFLAETTTRWEKAAARMEQLGLRTALIRIGVVLSARGGALEKMAKPVRMFAGAPLGSGDQYVSWVHIDDVCRLIVFALENESVGGPINATAPGAATNAELTRTIAEVLGRPLFLPNVPEAALRLMLGEMADVVLESARVEPKRARELGFEFQYPVLKSALQDLLAD